MLPSSDTILEAVPRKIISRLRGSLGFNSVFNTDLVTSLYSRLKNVKQATTSGPHLL